MINFNTLARWLVYVLAAFGAGWGIAGLVDMYETFFM